MHKVKISTVPTSTYPDFEKNGMLVSCKHILFVFLLAIKVDDETVSKARLISDEDIKAMLCNLQMKERFMKRSDSIPPSKKNFFL